MCFKAIAQSHFNEVFFFLTNVKYFVLSPISILLQFVFLDDLADLADDLDDLADDLPQTWIKKKLCSKNGLKTETDIKAEKIS